MDFIDTIGTARGQALALQCDFSGDVQLLLPREDEQDLRRDLFARNMVPHMRWPLEGQQLFGMAIAFHPRGNSVDANLRLIRFANGDRFIFGICPHVERAA